MKNVLILVLVSVLFSCSDKQAEESVNYVDIVDFDEFKASLPNRFGILKTQIDTLHNEKVSNDIFNRNNESVSKQLNSALLKIKSLEAKEINNKADIQLIKEGLSEQYKLINSLKKTKSPKVKKIKKEVKKVVIDFSLSQVNSWGGRLVAVIKIDNKYKTFYVKDYLKDGWFITDIKKGKVNISHTSGLQKRLLK